MKKISIFGLGKLGSGMLACYAKRGFEIIGVDINPDIVKKINNGKSPVDEPGVEKIISENKDRITVTHDSKKAISETDISFVILPTPSLDDGSLNLKYVESLIKDIGVHLKNKNRYHTIVINSTVLPGDMVKIKDLLEDVSKKRCSNDFGLCYAPELVAIGNIIHTFLNPDLIIIGESDSKAGQVVEEIYKKLIENDSPIFRMNFYNAELAKIAINSYLTMKMTFANILAEICEKMPGGDINIVTNAIGADSRIGRKYLKGGLAYGGRCFPRDNPALNNVALRFGVETKLPMTIHKINDYHKKIRIPNLIRSILNDKQDLKISILGLSFKENTDVIEGSASIATLKEISDSYEEIKVYDPKGMANAKGEITNLDNVKLCQNISECLKDTSLCFIAVPWDEFKSIDKSIFIEKMKTPIVLDAWNVLNIESDKIKIYRIGVDSD